MCMENTYESNLGGEIIMKVTYKTEVTVDAKDTNTQGKYTYIVALCCGGLMEDPRVPLS